MNLYIHDSTSIAALVGLVKYKLASKVEFSSFSEVEQVKYVVN